MTAKGEGAEGEMSDEELTVAFCAARFGDDANGRRALFNLGASRSSAAKDARIAALETMLLDLNDAAATRFGKWDAVIKAARAWRDSVGAHQSPAESVNRLMDAVDALGDDP